MKDEKARLYDELAAGLCERKRQFWVRKVSRPDFDNFLEMIKCDMPEIHEVDTIHCDSSDSDKFFTIKPDYLPCGGGDELAALERERRNIVSMITGESDWDRMLKLNDILCRSIVCREVGRDSHSILGPLLRKTSVCEGIAKAVKYICDAIDIPCYVVIGIAHPSSDGTIRCSHAWNKVFLDGNWFNVDVTSDIVTSSPEFISRIFFAVPDWAFARKYSEKRKTEKCWKRDGDYYARHGLVFNDLRTLLGHVSQGLRLSANFSFEFRFPYDMDGISTSGIADALDEVCGRCGRNGSYTVTGHAEMRTYRLEFKEL